MEKINNNKILRFFVSFISNTLFAMIFWPLLDMFFASIIDKREFVYSISKHIFEPVMYGLFLTIFLNASKGVAEKNQKK